MFEGFGRDEGAAFNDLIRQIQVLIEFLEVCFQHGNTLFYQQSNLIVLQLCRPVSALFAGLAVIKSPLEKGYGVSHAALLDIGLEDVAPYLRFDLHDGRYQSFHAIILHSDGFVVPSIDAVIPHVANYLYPRGHSNTWFTQSGLHELNLPIQFPSLGFHPHDHHPLNCSLAKVTDDPLGTFLRTLKMVHEGKSISDFVQRFSLDAIFSVFDQLAFPKGTTSDVSE